MFDYALWDDAQEVPGMDTAALLDFMYNRGFIDQIAKLDKVFISNDCHLYCRMPGDENDRLVSNSEVEPLIPALNMCMCNPEFRHLIDGYYERLNRLCTYLSGKHDGLHVDFTLLSCAPITDAEMFRAYMELHGLDDAIRVIDKICGHRSQSPASVTVKSLNRSILYFKGDIMDTNRLRTLYNAYVTLYERAVNDPNTSDAVMRDLNRFGDSAYSGAWTAIIQMFGDSDLFYPIREIGPNFWFCGRSIDEFREYMSASKGSADDYFSGTDTKDGFDDDVDIIYMAVRARKEGEHYVKVSLNSSSDTSACRAYRVPVDDILCEERLQKLREYVQVGMTAMAEIERDGKTNVPNVSYENLKEYQFGKTTSRAYAVWQYILSGDDTFVKPRNRSIGSALSAAAGSN